MPRTHSRTGCITCRLRRVKCDENHPFCQRCQNDRRVCSGYAPPVTRKSAERRSKYQIDSLRDARSQNPVPLQVSAHGLPMRCSLELEHFGYFVKRMSVSASGIFEAYIWQRLIPRFSHHEDSIHYALVALSCLHEMSSSPWSRRAHELRAVALTYYNKSIASLTVTTHRKEPAQFVVLMTCLIFIWIENLLANAEQAMIHARSALRLTVQLGRSSNSAFRSEDVDKDLRRFVQRLYIQGLLSGSPDVDVNLDLFVDEDLVMNVSQPFTTLDEAQYHLNTIIQSIFQFHKQATHPRTKRPAPPSIIAAVGSYLIRLQVWHHNFRSLFSSTIDTPITTRQAALYELFIQHLLTYIVLSTIISASPTTVYDAHTANFDRLLKATQSLLSLRNVKNSTSTSPPPFTPPLMAPIFYTLVRCRVPRLRRLALDLGSKCPRHEGVWNRDAMLAFARWKIDFEHRLALQESGIDPSSAEAEDAKASDDFVIPESARIFDEEPRITHLGEISGNDDGSVQTAVVMVRYTRRAYRLSTDGVKVDENLYTDVEVEVVTDLPLETVEMADLLFPVKRGSQMGASGVATAGWDAI